MGRGKGSRLSARVEDGVRHGALARAQRPTLAEQAALAERYIDEGMRMEDHPGVVFRDGPTGRRAGLASGPDVWEVVSVLQDQTEQGDAAIDAAAEWLSLPTSAVRSALSYYGAFTDEVDARVQAQPRSRPRLRGGVATRPSRAPVKLLLDEDVEAVAQ